MKTFRPLSTCDLRHVLLVALACLAVAPASAGAAATVQLRSDPEDPAGASAADVRSIKWTLDGASTTLDVALRKQDATGQRVLVWADDDADGAADLLVRIDRDRTDTAAIAVEPITQKVTAPCQPGIGDVPIVTDKVAPLTFDGALMRASITFPFAPSDGRFRWATYGESRTDPDPFDYVPDALAPAIAKDRLCGEVDRVADLSKAVRFPDTPPVAAFGTDPSAPLENTPFKAVASATDADGSIAQWRWELGSGDAFDDGSGPELALALAAGDHVVGLQVVDDDGLADVVRKTVTVAPAKPFFSLGELEIFSERLLFVPDAVKPSQGHALDNANKAPTIAIQIRPRRPHAGQIVTLDASRSRDDQKLASFEWDLDGDGETDDGRGARVRTAFGSAGTVRTTVLVRDEKGLASRESTAVRVRGAGPAELRRAIAGARRVRRLNGSFERGLGGWKRIGTAFAPAPSHPRALPAAVELQTASRLGGSYAAAGIPVGAKGRGWISSTQAVPGTRGLSPGARRELATGALVSPAFKISGRYLTLRIGGNDVRRGKRSLERVEVWVRKGGLQRRVATVAAGENEQLRTESIDLRRERGSWATVVVADGSSSGHVNVDDVDIGGQTPDGGVFELTPVVGFADTHTHPMVHQSFGGLRGHRTYMGVPGGRYADYQSEGRTGESGVAAYSADVKDKASHFAGSQLVRSVLEIVHSLAPDLAAGLHEQMHITEIHRAWEGGLRLMSSLAVSNQALEHVTGRIVDRATGGEPCVDPGGLCAPGGRVRATIATTSDRQIIEAHVLGMRQLARMNSDWMEIVYDPRRAHEVMSDGKLAVVLGSEVDGLGALGFESPDHEVDWLWRLGLRQIQPVHAIDNALGSPPAFQDLYNTTNDLVRRPERDARRDRIVDQIRDNGLNVFNPAAPFGAFMKLENWGCDRRHFALPEGECVEWRHDPKQKLLGLDFGHLLGGPHPMFADAGSDERPVYGTLLPDGQRNRGGLTPSGLRYVEALMKRGMLIDIEHMSDRTIDALVASGTIPGEARGPVWDALPLGEPGCEPGDSSHPRSVRPGCYDRAYPLMSSHTSFRGQSMVSPQNPVRDPRRPAATSLVKDYWAREFERTPRQVEYIRESGGTIAPVAGHDPIQRPPTATRPSRGAPVNAVIRGEDHPLRTNADRIDLNDCAGSSKSWITAYLYGVQKMGGRGVALSTDMAVVGSAGPRFNPPDANPLLRRNCPAGYKNFDPDFNVFDIANPLRAVEREIARSRDAEQAGYPWQYNHLGQNDATRVGYHDATAFRSGASLRRHTTPDRQTYDFNTQGIKTFGALPDLLQDAVNVGVDPEDLRPLLSSAQAYVDMWTKAYRVRDCDTGPATPAATYAVCAGAGPSAIADPAAVCANTCPDSPGRGHELLPDGRRLFP